MNEDEILDEIESRIAEVDRLKLEVIDYAYDEQTLNMRIVGPLLDQIAELSALSSYTGCQFALPRDIKDDLESIISLLGRYNSYRTQHRIFATKFRVERSRAGSLVKLDESDMDTIQSLIEETRKAIRTSVVLDDEYKQRLLSRLEILQLETHKVQSDMDKALAGLVEVGDALGKFGKKVKPLVDAFERIAGVFNSKRSEPLQLPAPPKQIEDKSGKPDD